MEDRSNQKIYIIGAGVSGLIAAQVLENHGYSPTIIEATDRVGGRVKTDIVSGYQLDYGFQVMLEAYPKTQQYLNYDKLDLQQLIPGAVLFEKGKRITLADPTRALSLIFPTLFSSIGNFKDRLKILKLNRELAKKELEAIFDSEEKTTRIYLQEYGFSEDMIRSFFKPFFTGIFLEDKLNTSSRMFEFVFKMFGEGLAVIPRAGIGAIPEQLKDKLKNTEFIFNTRVTTVTNETIGLQDGTQLPSQSTVIATEASNLVPNLNNQEMDWKSVDNLYFEVAKPVLNKPIIGLFKAENTLINNIFYPSTITTDNVGKKTLLSVSIVKHHEFTEKELIEKVEAELKIHASITGCKFLKRYRIKKALPRLDSLRYTMQPTETRLSTGIFLAGDQLLNGSLNAAMISGEQAALAVVKKLEGGIVS